MIRVIGFRHLLQRRLPPAGQPHAGLGNRLFQPVALAVDKGAELRQPLLLQPRDAEADGHVPGLGAEEVEGGERGFGCRRPHHVQMRVERGLVLGEPHVAVDAEHLGLHRAAREAAQVLGHQLGEEFRRFADRFIVMSLARIEPFLAVVLLQLREKGVCVVDHPGEAVAGHGRPFLSLAALSSTIHHIVGGVALPGGKPLC